MKDNSSKDLDASSSFVVKDNELFTGGATHEIIGVNYNHNTITLGPQIGPRRLWGHNADGWAAYFHFEGWLKIELGICISITELYIEVFVPFGYFRLGREAFIV